MCLVSLIRDFVNMANFQNCHSRFLLIFAACVLITAAEDTKPIEVDGNKVFSAEEIAQFDGSDVSST